MADFAVLESAIRRNTVLAATAGLILTVVTVVSLVVAVSALGNASEIRQRMPVMVVPGSVGGIYTPGLTEDSVRALARYLATLATNFSGARSFNERFDELETFAAPGFIPALQRARAELQKDVETQNQSRTFFATPGTEKLGAIANGGFDYFVDGDRMVLASGILMDTRRSEVRLRLRWGSPSRRNPSGVVLEGFDVRDLPSTPAAGAGTEK